MVRSTVCAKRSTTATSPSSNAKGKFERILISPTTCRSYLTGAARIERISSQLQLSVFTRGSVCASSQRRALPLRIHSPENPEVISSFEPSAGVFFPTLARHIIEPLWASAMAAPVPRVSEHARALIRRSARFRSEPSEPNSYWTVVDAGLSGAHASGSKLIASGSRISFVALPAILRGSAEIPSSAETGKGESTWQGSQRDLPSHLLPFILLVQPLFQRGEIFQ